jgi:hypothetical protein
MAKTQTKTKDDGIPPMLDRRNGKATPSYEELLAQIEALKAQVAHKSTLPNNDVSGSMAEVLAMSVRHPPRRGLRSLPRVEASGTAAHSSLYPY